MHLQRDLRDEMTAAAYGAETAEQVGECVERRRWNACCRREISILDDQNAARLEKSLHLTKTGDGVREVQQQKTAICHVGHHRRQPCVVGAGLNKGRVRNAFRSAELLCFANLSRIHVNAGHRSSWPHEDRKHPSDSADATAEIGNAHPRGKSCLQQEIATRWRIYAMKYFQPANGVSAGRQCVLADLDVGCKGIPPSFGFSHQLTRGGSARRDQGGLEFTRILRFDAKLAARLTTVGLPTSAQLATGGALRSKAWA